jgi:sec-independent protein translocase protein TatC
MSFLDHLEELRGVFLSCLWVYLLLVIGGWAVSGRLLDILVRHTVGTAQFIRPLEGFASRMKISLLVALIAGLPYFALRIWGFVVPGLLHHERRLVWPLVIWSTVLFLAGVAFSTLTLTPTMLRVLMSFQTEVIHADLAVGYLLDFFVKMAFACGLLFQLPLVIAALSYAGLVTPAFLKSKWRHAVLIILIVAAVVTPGDGPSQLVLAVPVIGLYFVSIGVSAGIHRRRRRAGEESA